jgi:hypothetical protein
LNKKKHESAVEVVLFSATALPACTLLAEFCAALPKDVLADVTMIII